MTGSVLVVAAALAALALVVNQMQARIGLLEVTLTEGLPPGHEPDATHPADPAAIRFAPQDVLAPGVHVFVSRSCFACQRLLEEIEHGWLTIDAPITLHHVDRPRPFARALADGLGFDLVEHDGELATGVGADPLPYTIAVGAHGLVARSVTPTVHFIHDTARDAGLQVSGARS